MPALKHELIPREMIVYLPPQYEAEGERRFPVLYMHDGQNLFDPRTSFIPGTYWRMGETADALIEAGAIEPLIIVGVYNAGVGRNDEYTPPGADAYGHRQGRSRADEEAGPLLAVESLARSIHSSARAGAPQMS